MITHFSSFPWGYAEVVRVVFLVPKNCPQAGAGVTEGHPAAHGSRTARVRGTWG